MPITPTQKKRDNKDDDNREVASSTATTTNKEKEVGKKPSPHPHLDVHHEHELVGGGGVSSPIMQMRNPYLPRHFQAYAYESPLSLDGQLDLSPLSHFDPPPPKRQKHEQDLVRMPSLLPTTTTNSPVRNKFGKDNEYYISPRSTPAQAALYSKKDPPPPLPAVAAAEEVKKKTKRDGGGGYAVVSFPMAFPKLPGKGKGKGVRSNNDSTTNKVTLTLWDQKFDELVSVCIATAYFISFFITIRFACSLYLPSSFSLILRSNTVIVECRNTMHRIANSEYG